MWHAWERWKILQGFVGKPEGKRSPRIPRSRWEDMFKMDL
jgi:hypothetical protein